jgi:hypothetical protein
MSAAGRGLGRFIDVSMMAGVCCRWPPDWHGRGCSRSWRVFVVVVVVVVRMLFRLASYAALGPNRTGQYDLTMHPDLERASMESSVIQL